MQTPSNRRIEPVKDIKNDLMTNKESISLRNSPSHRKEKPSGFPIVD
jgi:hypothetical protein